MCDVVACVEKCRPFDKSIDVSRDTAYQIDASVRIDGQTASDARFLQNWVHLLIFTQAGGSSAREAKLVPVQRAWWSNTAAETQQGVCEKVATLCRRIRQQRRTSRAQRL
ncbi:hypothetical protein Taro_056604 [Colocasia esculenta]|uniref:Uncharacterized protein n=1 Tax=Colocasia esculenta TaxID=4460 RepID=A0A843XUG2_COLES|nr:hypothetical protein [Colocasia esculenta]